MKGLLLVRYGEGEVQHKEDRSMKAAEIQALLPSIQQAVGDPLGPVFQQKMQAAGIEGPEWFALTVSLDYEPETTSIARFAHRNPYAIMTGLEETFATLVQKGIFAAANQPGDYRITAKGHQIAQEVLSSFETLSALEPLPRVEMERIMSLLSRIINAALTAPEPADKSCLVVNRHSDPGVESHPLYRFMQYSADLGSFRDDVHLSTWRPLGVSGPGWEAFSFIWRGDAHTAAELVEKLPHRRVDEAMYTAAIQDLIQRGWVEVVEGNYQVTEQGKTVRQYAEDETDRIYYAPWSALSPAELDELGTLLIRLRDHLNVEQEV
jgi:DNA-binding MarR family transcriptional regulator